MASYKIHSIKDSEKLSFIIEGENESSISQKLSAEGHIILSVEKIEVPTENLFCFEGKTPNGSPIEGKISADDIFLAYEMLKKEYKYTLTKLYPESTQDVKKQEKIFLDLLATFQENVTQKPKKTTDTSQKNLQKAKKTLQKLITILQKENDPAYQDTILELKKLDQNNNLSTTQDSLKTIVKKLSQNRESSLFQTLQPIRKEAGVYLLPGLLLSLWQNMQNMSGLFTPIIHPQEKRTPKHTEKTQDAIKNEYIAIQNNSHIHTFLRKKYRSKISHFFHPKSKTYYVYTLLRQKKSLYFSTKALSVLKKILIIALITTVFGMMVILLSGLYSTMFVTTSTTYIFWGFIIASLVIQSETV